jgi:Zn-finger nucleic acid-binding protein
MEYRFGNGGRLFSSGSNRRSLYFFRSPVRKHSDDRSRAFVDSPIPSHYTATMRCPKCNVDLLPANRHGLPAKVCPTCNGIWLEYKELEELEDEAFDFSEHDKGTLIFSSASTNCKCPQCGENLRKFQYRLDDLELEYCPNQHGFWLDADEDTRVLQLMQEKESDLERKVQAEQKWGARLNRMRSGSFFTRIRDWLE